MLLLQDYFDTDENIYNDIPLHDLIGTVSSVSSVSGSQSQDSVEDFCGSIGSDRNVLEEVERESGNIASTAKTTRWDPASTQQQQQQQQQVFLSLDTSVRRLKPASETDDLGSKKPPAYLASATARRAEEMLSSLGESIETTSTAASTFQDERENRKRKKELPENDLTELSDVLSNVADEFSRLVTGTRPGYPLSSMFGMDHSPAKMIRLQFDAKDSSSRVVVAAVDDVVDSPNRNPSPSDVDVITSRLDDVVDVDVDVAALADVGQSSGDHESSNGTEPGQKFGRETGSENSSSDKDEAAAAVGGLDGVSDFGRQSRSRRCCRRHCRRRCKRHRRQKRRRQNDDDDENGGFEETERANVSFFYYPF